MFTGSTRRRPHISYRGRSRYVTKSEAIQEARQERERRENERRQLEALECIIKNYRCMRAKYSEKQLLRNEFDKKRLDIEKVENLLASSGQTDFALPVKSLIELLRQCLVVFTPYNVDDIHRLAWVSKFLAKSFVTNREGANLETKAREVGDPFMETVRNVCVLTLVDLYWTIGVSMQSYISSNVSLRGYRCSHMQTYPSALFSRQQHQEACQALKLSVGTLLSLLSNRRIQRCPDCQAYLHQVGSESQQFREHVATACVRVLMASKRFVSAVEGYSLGNIHSDQIKDRFFEEEILMIADIALRSVHSSQSMLTGDGNVLKLCAQIIFCIQWDSADLPQVIQDIVYDGRLLSILITKLSYLEGGSSASPKEGTSMASENQKRPRSERLQPTFEELTMPNIFVNATTMVSYIATLVQANRGSSTQTGTCYLLSLMSQLIREMPGDLLGLRNYMLNNSEETNNARLSEEDSDSSLDLMDADDEAAANADPNLSILASIRLKLRDGTDSPLPIMEAKKSWETNSTLCNVVNDSWKRLTEFGQLGSLLDTVISWEPHSEDPAADNTLHQSLELIASVLIKLYCSDLPLHDVSDLGTSTEVMNRTRLPQSGTAKFIRNTILRFDIKSRMKKLWKTVKLWKGTHSGGIPDFSMFTVPFVFSNLLNQLLFTLTDDDFFEHAHPFDKNEVKAVVAYYNRLLKTFCWSSTMLRDRSFHSLLLLQQWIETYKRLYERHIRRPGIYTEEEEWLWEDVSLSVSGGSGEALLNTIESSEGLEGERSFFRSFFHSSTPNETNDNRTVSLKFLLLHVPMVIPFRERASLFETFLSRAKAGRNPFSGNTVLRVQRSSLLHDAMEGFAEFKDKGGQQILKTNLQLTFVDDQGLEEEGIDGGGLFKEFVDNATKEAFDPENGFFDTAANNTLYPHPDARFRGKRWSHRGALNHFEFMGELLGKAVYEQILVEPAFASFFLDKLLGRVNTIDDLASLDMEFYRSLIRLKYMSSDELDALDLTFETTDEINGKTLNVPLCPDGENLTVNRSNLPRYLYLMAHYKLNKRIQNQCRAFLNGFRKLIPQHWLRMFTSHEVQLIIGGTPRIDFDDMFKHTNFAGGYHRNHQTIKWLREVLEEMNWEDSSAFLAFITSCSRPPLLGFKMLQPNLGIRYVPEEDRLPTASTCANLLKLPNYSSKEMLRDKLLYAIRSKSGFNMS
eukprot:gb/GECG01015987.1/.p1 GENE.gb/GECG01015987.1/~~gb/GECG01015987.1/.p1  ORF type:complete len:1198 (+),score=136.72 gb/GECG01015987.1/:1-3594(+)